MKKLIVVRVGEYDASGKVLTQDGRDGMVKLSEKIKTVVNGSTVVLMSSDAARALASAAIIGEALGVKVEAHHRLFSDEQNPPRLDAGLKLVQERENEADVIIIVSHHGFSMYFPAHYARTKVKEEERGHAHPLSLEKGDGRGFDLATKELTHIRAT